MKKLLILLTLSFTSIASQTAQEKGLVCVGRECKPVEVTNTTDLDTSLRDEDFMVGKCYVDLEKGEFLRLLKIKKHRKDMNQLIFAKEKKEKDYTLTTDLRVLESKEFDRNLKKIDCGYTPTMNDLKYVEKCVDSSKTYAKKYYCEEPRKRR